MNYLVKIKDINSGEYILDETDKLSNEENKALFDSVKGFEEKKEKIKTVEIWDEVHEVTSYSIESDSETTVLTVEINRQSDNW